MQLMQLCRLRYGYFPIENPFCVKEKNGKNGLFTCNTCTHDKIWQMFRQAIHGLQRRFYMQACSYAPGRWQP